MSRSLIWFLYAVAILAIAYLQVFLCDIDSCAGIMIHDVYSLSKELDEIKRTGEFNLSNRMPYVGVVFLYYPIWYIDPSTVIYFNLFLVFLISRSIDYAFPDNENMRKGAMLGIVANPYILFLASGPNKDLPLVLITILFFSIISRNKRNTLLLGIVLGVVASLFRDGYGYLLIVMACINAVFRTPKQSLFAVLSVALGLQLIYGIAREYLPALARNQAAAQAIADKYDSMIIDISLLDNSFVFNILTYLLRVIGNSVSLSLRPQFLTDSGYVYPVGVAMWIYGVFLVVFIIGSCVVMFRPSEGRCSKSASVFLQIVLLVSISLFIQPRYLMPALPLAAAAYTSTFLALMKLHWMALSGAFVLAVILLAVGVAPPAANTNDFDQPSYLEVKILRK